jgi:hypothetical protein
VAAAVAEMRKGVVKPKSEVAALSSVRLMLEEAG